MKEGWTYKKLGEVCEVISGQSPENFATQKICIGRGLAAIRVGEHIDKDFLFFYLLANKNDIEGKEGVGFSSMNRKEIMDIGIYYPNDVMEQQRIAKRLDVAFSHIDELKANAEKQLSEARALFQKSLAKAMEPIEGWEEKNLIEITHEKCPISDDIVHKLSILPLSEQHRIVERLDALSAHVRELEENQKKIISECDALKQALLRKVFE